MSEFRQQIRNRRLLAIDDIDRLPRDEYVQQELRVTLDACDEAGAMIVVTSSNPVTTLAQSRGRRAEPAGSGSRAAARPAR